MKVAEWCRNVHSPTLVASSQARFRTRRFSELSEALPIRSPRVANPPAYRLLADGSLAPSPTVASIFASLLRRPFDLLIKRWNWKSAILSSLLRAAIFFFANLSAGLPAALAALHTELLLRAITSGFYGALTQAFSEAEPPWAATIAIALILPLANHALELLVHWTRGTPKLLPSILASMIFTALSTVFNFYAMRHGALIVGAGRRSLGEDMRAMPRLLFGFLLILPRSFWKPAAKRSSRPIG